MKLKHLSGFWFAYPVLLFTWESLRVAPVGLEEVYGCAGTGCAAASQGNMPPLHFPQINIWARSLEVNKTIRDTSLSQHLSHTMTVNQTTPYLLVSMAFQQNSEDIIIISSLTSINQ